MTKEMYRYCRDARKLLKLDVICGEKCPIFEFCPRLYLEDMADKVVEKAISEIVKGLKETK